MECLFELPPQWGSGFTVKHLESDDTDALQELFEQCADFSLLVEGVPPSPNAAHEALCSLPEGKEVHDKFMFGLLDNNSRLLAIIESIRHYPDTQTWWIGLMMVTPDQRGRGLGAHFYRAFERWVYKMGISRISLGVVEINELGLRFWKKMGFEVIKKTSPRAFGNRNYQVYVLTRKVVE